MMLEINKNVEKLLNKIEADFQPEIVPVKIESFSKVQDCYGNVEKKINKDGGEIYYGWKIHQTNILCEAEHHAVWKDNIDNLIDITPNESDSNHILFLPDNECVYKGTSIDNIRVNITNNFMVDDFIYVSELISKLYNLGDRKSSTELILPVDILKIITQHETAKERLLYLIENNIKYCICGAEKFYKNCCHKNLKISGQKQYEVAKRLVS